MELGVDRYPPEWLDGPNGERIKLQGVYEGPGLTPAKVEIWIDDQRADVIDGQWTDYGEAITAARQVALEWCAKR